MAPLTSNHDKPPLLWYSKKQWEKFSETDKFMKAVQFNIAFKRNISIPASQIAVVKDAVTCLRLTFEILKKRGMTTVMMRRTANALIYSFLKDLGFKLVFVELGMEGFTVDLIKEVVEREEITLEGSVHRAYD